VEKFEIKYGLIEQDNRELNMIADIVALKETVNELIDLFTGSRGTHNTADASREAVPGLCEVCKHGCLKQCLCLCHKQQNSRGAGTPASPSEAKEKDRDAAQALILCRHEKEHNHAYWCKTCAVMCSCGSNAAQHSCPSRDRLFEAANSGDEDNTN